MEVLARFWPQVVALLAVTAATLASAHAILYKRHTRGIVAWMGLIWLLPAVGPALYLVLGINRLNRRAIELRGTGAFRAATPPPPGVPEPLLPLATLVWNVSRRRLIPGNALELYQDGDASFPAMLDAINAAERSIALCMYIFDCDQVGMQFIEALERAAKRGVQVRVLIDGIGSRYSFPKNAAKELSKRGVTTRLFLWSWNPIRMAYLNLRNHRKVLIVDGSIGFTGDLNIRKHHLLKEPSRMPTRGLMVRITGPVVAELVEVFAWDWEFTSREKLEGSAWYPELTETGPVLARALPDGPDENFDVAARTFAGALIAARHSVRILTPYFLPDEELTASLENVALSGIEMDVVVPELNNLPYMKRAMIADIPSVLRRGVRAWFSPPPFDHSKLMVVDEQWVCLGSANWDERSLRLNFELNLECYHDGFARMVDALIRERRDASRALTFKEVMARPIPVKLFDGVLRLFKPYI